MEKMIRQPDFTLIRTKEGIKVLTKFRALEKEWHDFKDRPTNSEYNTNLINKDIYEYQLAKRKNRI